MLKRRLGLVIGALLLLGTALLQPFAGQAAPARGRDYVKRVGSNLMLDGQFFRFGGTNNYYLMYKSRAMVDNVLETAAANNFKVVRTWGWLDIGNQDGSNSVAGKSDGVYFQYWNGSAPAYNDGDDGLKRLDYVIAKAGEEGLRLVIPFTNNWRDFGGMDQYVRWRGGQYHDDFYTDPTIRQWYKNWIAHLLNRTNSITGIKYKDDPTIMTWELGNEPRCKGSGVYPTSSACTTQTLITWADDVSRFVKSIDRNHLVSVGDEGFYCNPGSTDWTENCGEGVDTIAFTKLRAIDVMSMHLYPDGWGKDPAWGTQWIKRHIEDARANNKAVMLGEFGLLDKNIRNRVYKEWTDAVQKSGGNGALYWILSDKQDDGGYYADYDGFTVYCPSPVCITLGNFAQIMAGRDPAFPPVADHDTVVAEFGTAVTLNPPANDITYGRTTLVRESIDLDPATAGQQSTQLTPGGSFALNTDGTVRFTPTAGFAGKTQTSYTIRDSRNRVSNPANLVVTVKPDPSAALTLFSFETGTEGWAAASWQTNAGTTAQSNAYQSDGNASLQVTTADGGWFGATFSEPLDLSQKATLKLELQTGAVGTSSNVALQLGDSFAWCQATFDWTNPDTEKTITIDLLNGLSCEGGGEPNLSSVRSIFVYLSANGTFYLDNVRAE